MPHKGFQQVGKDYALSALEGEAKPNTVTCIIHIDSPLAKTVFDLWCYSFFHI